MTGRSTRADRGLALRRRRSSRLGSMALVSVLVLVGGWSALWLFGRSQARSSFDQWVEREARQGRVWTCPNQQIGGYPMSIVLSCDHPSFSGPLAAGQYRGELAGFSAEASLHNPTSVSIRLAGPLDLHDADGTTGFHLTWSEAGVELRGDMPGDLDRGEITAGTVAMAVTGTDPFQLSIGQIEMSLRLVKQGGTTLPDLDLAVAASGIRNAEADAAFGSSDPASIDVKASATRFLPNGTSLRQALEPWRQAGGSLTITSVDVSKGPFRASGTGRLALDEGHRAAGKLDAHFAGLEPLAAHWGLPIGAVKLGGALSSLLGGKKAAPVPAGDLALPLVARDGNLLIGPVNTGVKLLPLY